MNDQPIFLHPNRGQTVGVSRCDRWAAHRRLQELGIPCDCPKDGTLRVEVNNAIALALVRSTVRQFTISRQEAVDWLENCWANPLVCQSDR